jgi:hypothetical protein
MAQQETENKKAETKKTGRGLRWWAGMIMLVAAVVLAILWLTERLTLLSAKQRLAAIEAARAIPDEQNAAVIYSDVLANTDLASGQPAFLSRAGLSAPWLSADHPDAADWLQAHQSAISRLLEASQKQKCHLPLAVGPAYAAGRVHLVRAVRPWAQLLVSAANNDVAEGRIDAALKKYRCIMRMAAHLQQPPLIVYFLPGIAIDAFAMGYIKGLIVQGDVTDGHLDMIEQSLGSTQDNWDETWTKLWEMEGLHERLEPGNWDFLRWLKRIFSSKGDLSRRVRTYYVRLLAARRSSLILVAVRKYKNQNGRWPQSLADITHVGPPQIFIDPVNGSSFVYKPTAESFTLYSTGQNNIDENGNHTGGADDWLIWPPKSPLREDQMQPEEPPS